MRRIGALLSVALFFSSALYASASTPVICATATGALIAAVGGVCPSDAPSASPTPSATPLVVVAPTTTPLVVVPTSVPIPGVTPNAVPTAPALVTYDSGKACIANKVYTNDVLPPNVGEFSAHGLNRAFWGGTQTRTLGVNAGSWKGFNTSWGRHQYDTYFADLSDGLNIDPFSVGPDKDAPGAPNALRIDAGVLPTNIARSLTVLANDQWQVTTATADIKMPAEGSSIDIPVTDPNAAQTGWDIGMGYENGAYTWVGKLTNGATPSGDRTGGHSPWHIINIHRYSGNPGDVIHPNDEGGLRSYHFPDYWSGVLDTNFNQQYGFFVSRIRMPKYLPAISPAFWTLATAVPKDAQGNLIRHELDIAEMFGATSGNALNFNEIAWNQPWKAGVGVVPLAFDPNLDYHDYGVLVAPGNVTFYIDGKPIPGDSNLPDWTQGSADKEMMLMIQVGGPGGWLDPGSQGFTNHWPVSMYSQWIRAYRPTTNGC